MKRRDGDHRGNPRKERVFSRYMEEMLSFNLSLLQIGIKE